MTFEITPGELLHRKRKLLCDSSCKHNPTMIAYTYRSKTYILMAIGTAILILAAVGIVHITSALSAGSKKLEPPDPQVPLPPSPSILRKFKTGAVCSDGPPCSRIGSDILQQNGSAVDAAIATLFCNGIVNCHSMGLGGGFFMTIYKRDTRTGYFLNARETAPAASTPDMYSSNPDLARRGALAVGVPGELAGYWAAHQRFGRLPWNKLIEPSLKICRDGYNMSQHQYNALEYAEDDIVKDETLREIFISPSDGKIRKMGSNIVQKRLCETLKIISENGITEFYNGSLARAMVNDIRELGGIITEQDLANYRVQWSDPIKMKLKDGSTLFTAPPPGSGVILALILNILGGYDITRESVGNINSTILTYHRIVEAFKYGFGKRTELGDPKFVDVKDIVFNSTLKSYGEYIRENINDDFTHDDPRHYGALFYNKEDHGTAHISVLAPDGDAVSITSTVNIYATSTGDANSSEVGETSGVTSKSNAGFGAGIASKSTGVILNSGMDDFSSSHFKNFFGLPGSPANRVEPGKQPLSSMSPTIMVDSDGEVHLVIGAAGGTKIPTAVAYVIIRHLWFGDDIKSAIDASRLHHQLYPMSLFYEYGLLEDIILGLQKLGHKMSRYRKRISVICAIARINGTILANADYRKKGDVHGF